MTDKTDKALDRLFRPPLYVKMWRLLRRLLVSIKSALKWSIRGSRVRPWDFDFLVDVIIWQLEDMRDSFINANVKHEKIDQDILDIEKAIKMLKEAPDVCLDRYISKQESPYKEAFEFIGTRVERWWW